MSGLDNTSYTVRTAAAATTLTSNDSVLLCTPTASFTVTVPAGSSVQPGRVYVVRQSAVSGNQVTLAPATGTIDGVATLVVGAVNTIASLRIVTDGTNWFTIA